MLSIRHFVRLLAALLAIALALPVGDVRAQSPQPSISPTRQELSRSIDRLELELANEQKLREQQSNSADYYFQAAAILVAVAAAVIAVVAIVTAFLGYGFVRGYVDRQFDKRVAEQIADRGAPEFEAKARELEERYDARLAELVERVEGSIARRENE